MSSSSIAVDPGLPQRSLESTQGNVANLEQRSALFQERLKASGGKPPPAPTPRKDLHVEPRSPPAEWKGKSDAAVKDVADRWLDEFHKQAQKSRSSHVEADARMAALAAVSESLQRACNSIDDNATAESRAETCRDELRRAASEARSFYADAEAWHVIHVESVRLGEEAVEKICQEVSDLTVGFAQSFKTLTDTTEKSGEELKTLKAEVTYWKSEAAKQQMRSESMEKTCAEDMGRAARVAAAQAVAQTAVRAVAASQAGPQGIGTSSSTKSDVQDINSIAAAGNTLTPLRSSLTPCAHRNNVPAYSDDHILYLPKQIKGLVLVFKEVGNSWRAHNLKLQSTTPGLSFRRSKVFDDKSDVYLPWGSTVEGTDEEDGWIKCDMRQAMPLLQTKHGKPALQDQSCASEPQASPRFCGPAAISEAGAFPAMSQQHRREDDEKVVVVASGASAKEASLAEDASRWRAFCASRHISPEVAECSRKRDRSVNSRETNADMLSASKGEEFAVARPDAARHRDGARGSSLGRSSSRGRRGSSVRTDGVGGGGGRGVASHAASASSSGRQDAAAHGDESALAVPAKRRDGWLSRLFSRSSSNWHQEQRQEYHHVQPQGHHALKPHHASRRRSAAPDGGAGAGSAHPAAAPPTKSSSTAAFRSRGRLGGA